MGFTGNKIHEQLLFCRELQNTVGHDSDKKLDFFVNLVYNLGHDGCVRAQYFSKRIFYAYK